MTCIEPALLLEIFENAQLVDVTYLSPVSSSLDFGAVLEDQMLKSSDKECSKWNENCC